MSYDAIPLFACRAAERAAVAASRWIGKGDSKAADQAAVEAMRAYFGDIPIDGTVVIGEGERDEAPMLYIGEKVGCGGVKTDIALDPLEGTDICAQGKDNSLAVIGMTEAGGAFLHAADVYMEKIAVGIPMPQGAIDLDNKPADNIAHYAEAANKAQADVTVCILDRPRHAELIAAVRQAGAKVKLIGDGDIYAVMATVLETSEIDIYMGIGGAPEGVLAAAALRCVGGDIQGRLIFDSAEKQMRARTMGIEDLARKYHAHDMARGDVVFAATGVTGGELLKGVEWSACGGFVHCETLILRSKSGSMRRLSARLPVSELS